MRITRCEPIARRQAGFAMIALLTLLALIGAYLISSLLTRTNSEVLVERSLRAQDALLQAKAALIAEAASADSTQPGSLLCPDTNDDGIAEGSCSGTNVVVGRLPWRSLGIGDLRDAGGERLWYALSPNFRRMASTVVNSDTRGQLTLTDGTTSAANIVAVVIAPGAAISGQSRGTANVNAAASYMESTNAGTTGTLTYSSGQPSDTFNDRVIAITEADLFAMVEPVVAIRIERDVKPYVATYYSQWASTFPFPSRFDNPDPGSNSNVSPPVTTRAQDQYVGDITQTPGGLLPVTANATYPLNTGTGSVTMNGGIYGVYSVAPACTNVTLPIGTSGFYCTFTLRALNSVATCGAATPYCMVNPAFQVRGEIANIGMSFADMADSDVAVTNAGGTTARAMLSRTVSRTMSNTGVATVVFQGTHNYATPSTSYRTATFTRSFRVTFPVVASAFTNASNTSNWFITNEWYRMTYYAVSPAHLPGAISGGCPTNGACLTVNNMPSYYTSPNTDKRAILILGGRPLNGTSRPSATLGNYLESTNATPGNYIFEHRAGLPSSINDRVVVISP